MTNSLSPIRNLPPTPINPKMKLDTGGDDDNENEIEISSEDSFEERYFNRNLKYMQSKIII